MTDFEDEIDREGLAQRDDNPFADCDDLPGPPEVERTMPVGPFLDSLNHDDNCNCGWCRNGDRADEAIEREGDR